MSITKVTAELINSVDSTQVTNLTTYNDNNIVNDLSTLALRQASYENKAAYNTSSMYIDVFQDSTGITGLSDTERNASEYMRAWGSTSVPYDAGIDYAGASTFGLIQLSNEGQAVNGGHTGSYDGDSIVTETGSSHNGATIARAFSCAADFKIRLYALNSSGNRHAVSYPGYGGVMIPDDTFKRTNGENSDLWNLSRNSSLNNFMPSPTASSWATLFMNTAYATAQSVSTYQSFENTASQNGSAQQNFNCNGNGFRVVGYKNDGSTNNYGLFVHYNSSTNTLYSGILSGSSDSNSTHSHAATQVSNVPSTGTFLFAGGDANGSVNQNAGLRKYSLTYNGHPGADNTATYDIYPAGSFVTEALVAAGSFESNVITVSSSITSMGAIITYQDNTGTNVLNTDIILKLSADGGVTYSTATLVSMPDFSSGIKMAKVNDLSVTAGTSLKYKIEFANQSDGTKVAHIRGISLQY